MSKSAEVRITIENRASDAIAQGRAQIDRSIIEKFSSYIDWLRTYLPTTELDTSRIIMAKVLTQITGDDLNHFAFYSSDFSPDTYAQMKQNVLDQVDIEIAIPETPKKIRTQLKKVRKQLAAIDWQEKEGYDKAKEIWLSEIRDYTQRQMNKTEELDTAVMYVWHHSPSINRAWQKEAASRGIKI